MGGELSLKLPFTLMHTCPEYELLGSSLKRQKSIPITESIDVRPDKDGTTTWSEENLESTTNENELPTTSHQNKDIDNEINTNIIENKLVEHINQDLDAIVTETKCEQDKTIKMVTMVVEDRHFSGSRAWCCLGARRSS